MNITQLELELRESLDKVIVQGIKICNNRFGVNDTNEGWEFNYDQPDTNDSGVCAIGAWAIHTQPRSGYLLSIAQEHFGLTYREINCFLDGFDNTVHEKLCGKLRRNCPHFELGKKLTKEYVKKERPRKLIS